MSRTTLDLDDEALAATMRLAGVTTKKDAVNTALREYAARHRRIETVAGTVQDRRERNIHSTPA
ncbi:type II toxin-antitoxin system VapB family antitoxin [Streptomyces sp. NPDC004647]|uniref:type II toxin-antitoxin system VapB family antitoxin n=1 Tax=Streptomyces sp. NPDC004647 TaxID=3154671 RepID=UPI0033BCAE8E